MKQILILQAGCPKGNTARLSEAVAEGAREAGMGEVYHFDSQEQAMPTILSQLQPGTTILVKASRMMRFERIVEALTAAAKGGG